VRDTDYSHIGIIAIYQIPKGLDVFAATIPVVDKLREESLVSIDAIRMLVELDVR
jgi:hypothetical protein